MLVLTLQDASRQSFQLEEGMLSIGRAATNTVVISDRRISSRHCQISARQGEYFFRDFISTNGSMVCRGDSNLVVDGKQVAEMKLEDGDLLYLGDITSPVTLGVKITGGTLRKQGNETIIAKRSLIAATDIKPDYASISLEDLFRFLREVAEKQEFNAIAEHVARYCFTIMKQATHVIFTKGADEGFAITFEKTRDSAARGQAPKSQTLLGEVVKRGEAILFGDQLDAISTTESIARFELTSAIYAPLIYRARVFGTLQISSVRGARPFSRAELDLCAVVANQVAAILMNAQLFDEVRAMRDRLKSENRYLKQRMEVESPYRHIIGESLAMKRVFTQIDLVAPSDTTVLLLGDTGTGKELVARSIHNNSPQKDRIFAAVNCGAIAESLLESELFGHVKGAFTGAIRDKKGMFEIADGGTLFLDEVSEIPLAVQVKLLRALQEMEIQPVGGVKPKKVNARIVAATNRNLAQDVAEGKFRQDLYYRINVFPIELPPLCQRGDDVKLLAEHFLNIYSNKLNRDNCGLTPEALEALAGYAFPGNVRELQNEIERAVLLTPEGRPIGVENLSSKLGDHTAPIPQVKMQSGQTLKEMMDSLETQVIRKCLDENNWNRAKTARKLGISRQGFMVKLSKLKITPDT